MDDIARRVGMDPLELRLQHLVKEGDVFVTGEKLVSVGVADCLKRTADALGWKGEEEQAPAVPEGNRVRGNGLAVAIKSTTTPTTSSANVRLNADGSAVLLTSSVDMGQGALTSLAQIVADELGLPFERVTVSSPDTDMTPTTTTSRLTTFHGISSAKLRGDSQPVLDVTARALEGASKI
jgi:CO/xanthine dehydrogenase Mo-binding subunit